MHCAGGRGQWHPQLCGTQGVEVGSTYAARIQHGKHFCKNGSKMPKWHRGERWIWWTLTPKFSKKNLISPYLVLTIRTGPEDHEFGEEDEQVNLIF